MASPLAVLPLASTGPLARAAGVLVIGRPGDPTARPASRFLSPSHQASRSPRVGHRLSRCSRSSRAHSRAATRPPQPRRLSARSHAVLRFWHNRTGAEPEAIHGAHGAARLGRSRRTRTAHSLPATRILAETRLFAQYPVGWFLSPANAGVQGFRAGCSTISFGFAARDTRMRIGYRE